MAKYRRRRYYRKRARWASNIQEFNNELVNMSGQGNFSKSITLVTNPAQATSAGSAILTVKNIEAAFEMEVTGVNTSQLVEGLQFYIMYLPQGYQAPNNTFAIEHPEWVMAYKFYGSPAGDIIQQSTSSLQMAGLTKGPFKVKTRLARKLNTGDRIILFIKGLHEDTTTHTCQINGLVRWWTKYN